MLVFDDFEIGRAFPLGPKLVTSQEIIEFAAEFDPQPFHLDPESPQAELVGGLIASGWHTCAMVMAMMCESYLLNTASLGSGGLESIRWLHPVRPGDTLTGEAKVMDRRVSASNPKMGIVTFAYGLQNQDGTKVLAINGTGFVRKNLPA
jgi:acyl dehydratase